jgi:hypothetical protein
VHAELGVDATEVVVDRTGGDAQRSPDLRARAPCRGQLRDLAFPAGQREVGGNGGEQWSRRPGTALAQPASTLGHMNSSPGAEHR